MSFAISPALIIPATLPDCSLNEDNFSLRCPKHKVTNKRVAFTLCLRNCAGILNEVFVVYKKWMI